MRYLVAVWRTGGIYSGEVPDLPGVVTEADSVEALEAAVKEAASGWMEAELDAGRPLPVPAGLEAYAGKDAYKDCLWMLVDIAPAALSEKTERVNVCLPARVLRRLDFLAQRAGESRSGYLSRLILTTS